MTNVEYEDLIYHLGTEIKKDPNVDLERSMFICRKKIPKENREHIEDVFKLFDELENSGNLSIDNLGFLKEFLEGLKKHSCLEKVVAFEAKRRSSVELLGPVVIAAEGGGEDKRVGVVSLGVALEQRDEGKNFVIETYTNKENM